MARIAHLTSVHIPTDTRILYKECRTLAENGHDVMLIAPADAGWTRDGVRLVPVPKPAGRLSRMTTTTWQVFRTAIRLGADVFHFHDPELIPMAALLPKRFGKVVYDVHEDYAGEIVARQWIDPRLRRPAAKATATAEQLAVHRFDLVVAATQTIGRLFPAEKTVVVQNFPFLDELADAAGGVSYAHRPPVVAFVGDLTGIRGAKEMVQAMAHVPERVGARLVLGGRFNPPTLEKEVATLPGRDAVDHLGWLERDGVRQLLARARLGLVLLHPTPNHLAAQPNKLFEYMSASLPVVASDFPAWRDIVQESGCGLLVDPLDVQAIGEAVTWLLEHPDEAHAMGRRGRDAVERLYNWESESVTLLEAYDRLLGG